MQRTMLKSKIHRARVTAAGTENDECILIDRDLMRRADLWPFERVDVYNVDNGARFTTVVQEAEAGSGTIAVHGAAAHLARVGQQLEVVSYIMIAEADLSRYQPRRVVVDAKPKAARQLFPAT